MAIVEDNAWLRVRQLAAQKKVFNWYYDVEAILAVEPIKSDSK